MGKTQQTGKKTKRLTIEEMRTLASQRGGKCLSKAYENYHTKLKWQCGLGHIWKTTPGHVKHGTWCPACTKGSKSTLADMQALAERKKGLCLSKTYVDMKTKLLWQCQKGHVWEASPTGVKSGTWCPTCAEERRRLSLVKMQELAGQRGGRCVSKVYTNCRTRLTWECQKGHLWDTLVWSIKQGTWCPQCYRVKRTSSGANGKIYRYS